VWADRLSRKAILWIAEQETTGSKNLATVLFLNSDLLFLLYAGAEKAVEFDWNIDLLLVKFKKGTLPNLEGNLTLKT